MMKERKIFQPLSSKDVCQVYESLLKNNEVVFPLTKEARHKVESIVANITSFYFGEEIYKTAEQKALAYLYFLIKDHPFTDGNKRTAVLVFIILCEINDLKEPYRQFDLDSLAVLLQKPMGIGHHEVIQIVAEEIFKK